MDVPTTTPGNERSEQVDVTVNAYEVYWDCVDSDDRMAASSPAGSATGEDAYAQFWLESDS